MPIDLKEKREKAEAGREENERIQEEFYGVIIPKIKNFLKQNPEKEYSQKELIECCNIKPWIYQYMVTYVLRTCKRGIKEITESQGRGYIPYYVYDPTTDPDQKKGLLGSLLGI